ncbi:hypothetical protein UT300005_10370 [Clostridium sp. CTA-5]
MKNQFEILNKIQNKDNYNEENLTEQEKQAIVNRISKKIKNNKNKKYYKKATAAVLCCILLGSSLMTNEEVLAAINDKIEKTIESFFEKDEEVVKDYKQNVLKEVEDKGINFIVHEAVIDGNELLVSVSIDYSKFNTRKFNTKSNEVFKITPNWSNFNINIIQNGEKKILNESGITYNNNEHDKDKILNMLLTAKIENPNLKDNYTVDLNINKMNSNTDNDILIEGDWNLTFEVNNNDNGKTYTIDKKIDLISQDENIDVTLEEIRVSPLLLKTRYKFNGSNGEKFVKFKIVDEYGKEVCAYGGGGAPEGVEYTYIPNKDMKSIKLIPGIENTFEIDNIKYFEDKAINIKLD